MKEKLRELLKNSYAPYSNMRFACIVEAKSGALYSGVNVENVSYGGAICAERNAINNAVGAGERKFKALYLMSNSNEKFLFPCHICKQTFLEFFDEDVLFNVMKENGEMKVMTFNEIMDSRFIKGDI